MDMNIYKLFSNIQYFAVHDEGYVCSCILLKDIPQQYKNKAIKILKDDGWYFDKHLPEHQTGKYASGFKHMHHIMYNA